MDLEKVEVTIQSEESLISTTINKENEYTEQPKRLFKIELVEDLFSYYLVKGYK